MTVIPRMLPAARRSLIATLLNEAGALTTDEVSKQLGISWMTVRRDFEALEREGLARRTHGGAVLPSADLPAAGPAAATADEARVAHAAAAIIGDGESVILDASPCAYAVACELIGRRLTVITNSLLVMDAVARGGEATRLIGLCGRLDPDRGAFTGAPVLAAARGHFADRLLLGADALAADGRLLDGDAAGAEVKRALVAQSDQVLLLATGRMPAAATGSLVARAPELAGALCAGGPDLRPLRDAGVPVRSV